MNFPEETPKRTLFEANNMISHLEATVRKLERQVKHIESLGNRKWLIRQNAELLVENKKQQEVIDSLVLLLDK